MCQCLKLVCYIQIVLIYTTQGLNMCGMCVCVRACIHVHACMNACVCVCVHVCVLTCVHACQSFALTLPNCQRQVDLVFW